MGFFRMIGAVIILALGYGILSAAYESQPAQKIAGVAKVVSESVGPAVVFAPRSTLAQVGEAFGMPLHQRKKF